MRVAILALTLSVLCFPALAGGTKPAAVDCKDPANKEFLECRIDTLETKYKDLDGKLSTLNTTVTNQGHDLTSNLDALASKFSALTFHAQEPKKITQVFEIFGIYNGEHYTAGQTKNFTDCQGSEEGVGSNKCSESALDFCKSQTYMAGQPINQITSDLGQQVVRKIFFLCFGKN